MASTSHEKVALPMAGIWKDFAGGSDGNRFDGNRWKDFAVSPGSLIVILITLAF
ncbi:hypothetical protein A2U01_0113390 [Trifolium medium]|uniref:Uncharacterized protein n=1 Tax=Trifolium medium TaxID=97028 RepID=A0A392VUL8_9FABA|nr:hypothetical protein [Trifolium medium]